MVKHLLIAYFIANISAKKISKSIHVRQSYSKPKVGRFLRHSVFMVTLWYRADHYIFILSSVLLSSSFFFFLFSSPNLSRPRLDVCHTSTHGVTLVRI